MTGNDGRAPIAVVLMGVSGCGKTSVGRCLSDKLGWKYFDGDDFHPQANIDKMAAGFPLDDQDRRPWLERLHRLMAELLESGQSILVGCSALKRSYRQILRGTLPNVVFVHLTGSFELISGRLQARTGHYMKPEMLRSQFDTLEPPKNALEVDIRPPIHTIAAEILRQLPLR